MSISVSEAMQLKADVEVLKASANQVIEALNKNINEQKQINKTLNTIAVKLREGDVRDEYRSKEIKAVKDALDSSVALAVKFKQTYERPLNELLRVQSAKSAIYSGAFMAWGKVLALLFVAGAAYIFGADFTKFMK